MREEKERGEKAKKGRNACFRKVVVLFFAFFLHVDIVGRRKC